MAQKKATGKEIDTTGICGELVTTLQRLFQLMRDNSINFGFMNLRHDAQYEGTHVPFILRPAELAGVRVEQGQAVIQSDEAIFRIYKSRRDSISEKLTTFLEWAKQKVAELASGISGTIRMITVPQSIPFFSAPRNPAR